MIVPAEKLALLEATTPPTAQVLDRTRNYLALAQISIAELAHRIRYGSSSLRRFLNGTYIEVGNAATDVHIRRALNEFMNAHPIEISTVTSGRLHETANVRIMRHWFDRCLARRELAFVYGPPGAQKTFVFSHLVAEHNLREIGKNGHGTRAYLVYCSEQITPRQLLGKMVRAAAIPGASSIPTLMDNLRHHLTRRRALFVLDEAQHLSISCLEIVRELNDCDPHCGILLAGSHRLAQMFRARSAELEQWNSRIASGVELPGMTEEESVQVIEAELGLQKPRQMELLLQNALAKDGYSKNRHSYYSARRLFRQIAEIQDRLAQQ